MFWWGMIVYLVFKANPDTRPEIQGVFSKRKKAEKACTTWFHCICPLELDKQLPEELVEPWPGAYFPMAQEHFDGPKHQEFLATGG